MPSIKGKRLLAALEDFSQSGEGSRDPKLREAVRTLSDGLKVGEQVTGSTPGQREVESATNNIPSRNVPSSLHHNSDELTPGEKAALDASVDIV